MNYVNHTLKPCERNHAQEQLVEAHSAAVKRYRAAHPGQDLHPDQIIPSALYQFNEDWRARVGKPRYLDHTQLPVLHPTAKIASHIQNESIIWLDFADPQICKFFEIAHSDFGTNLSCPNHAKRLGLYCKKNMSYSAAVQAFRLLKLKSPIVLDKSTMQELQPDCLRYCFATASQGTRYEKHFRSVAAFLNPAPDGKIPKVRYGRTGSIVPLKNKSFRAGEEVFCANSAMLAPVLATDSLSDDAH